MRIKELHDSYAQNPDFKPLMEVIRHLSMENPLAVEQLHEQVIFHDPDGAWTRSEVVQGLQELAELGCGKFIKGARGQPSRIEWQHPPKEIAEYALGERALPSSAVGHDVAEDLDIFRDKGRWTIDEILELLARISRLPKNEILIDLRIADAKALFAKVQGIEERDVAINLG